MPSGAPNPFLVVATIVGRYEGSVIRTSPCFCTLHEVINKSPTAATEMIAIRFITEFLFSIVQLSESEHMPAHGAEQSDECSDMNEGAGHFEGDGKDQRAR